MARTTADKFLDAIGESYGAILAVMESTEGSGHKVSRTVLAEVRKAEREALALARKWVDTPTSLFENLAAAIAVQNAAEQRALELARESLTGSDAYRREVQQALGRLVRANRVSAQALSEAVGAARGGAAQRMRETGARARSLTRTQSKPASGRRRGAESSPRERCRAPDPARHPQVAASRRSITDVSCVRM